MIQCARRISVPPAMFRRALLAVVLTLPGLAATAAEPKHLVEARALVEKLPPDRSSYTHGPGVIKWETPCAAHVDCSAFLDHLFMHCYRLGEDDLRRWFNTRNRPLAHHYYEAI